MSENESHISKEEAADKVTKMISDIQGTEPGVVGYSIIQTQHGKRLSENEIEALTDSMLIDGNGFAITEIFNLENTDIAVVVGKPETRKQILTAFQKKTNITFEDLT